MVSVLCGLAIAASACSTGDDISTENRFGQNNTTVELAEGREPLQISSVSNAAGVTPDGSDSSVSAATNVSESASTTAANARTVNTPSSKTSNPAGSTTRPATGPVTTARPAGTSTTRAPTVSNGKPTIVVDVGVRQNSASSRSLYVNPTSGSDAGAGSEAQPWRSLANSLPKLKPGDTLYLMNGEYAETMNAGVAHYLVSSQGQKANWIRITAAPGHNPVVIGSRAPAIEVRGNYIEVSNLTLKGRGYTVANPWGVGLSARKNHSVLFKGNTVTNFALAGINTVEASDVSVIGNTVYGNAAVSPSQGSGISLWSSKNQSGDTGTNRIIGNRVYKNENKQPNSSGRIVNGNGIVIEDAQTFNYQGKFLVANNLVYENGGSGIHIYRSNNVDVVSNSTYHNSKTAGIVGKGELAAGRSSNINFYNNLAWADTATSVPGLNLDSSSPAVTFKSAGNVYVTKVGANSSSQDFVTTTAPSVINAAATIPDLRPRSGSVLTTKSVIAGPAQSRDFYNKVRPSRPAVGAFEPAN